MDEIKKLSSVTVGDTEVVYWQNIKSGQVELALVPAAAPAPALDRSEIDNAELTPLAEVKIRGDHNTCGFGAGRSMRHNGSTEQFRFREQQMRGLHGVGRIPQPFPETGHARHDRKFCARRARPLRVRRTA